MARLHFFKGAITGKLGEFVGARWKGVNYIRQFTKPSNPKTQKQTAVRAVFANISAWATALFRVGFHSLIPPQPKMTQRNTVFMANKGMIASKAYNAELLQVSPPNLPIDFHNLSYDTATEGIDISLGKLQNHPLDGYLAHFILWDTVNNVIAERVSIPVSFLPDDAKITQDRVHAVLNNQGLQYLHFLVVTGSGYKGERLISKTFMVTGELY